tara:strand:- start:497 stop:1123 length:627 start_codon:yes stop_codon:yes gene_type:complete
MLTIFGYNKRTEYHPDRFYSNAPFEDEIYDFYGRHGNRLIKISAITEAGECGSGYCTATHGYLREEDILAVPPLEYIANPPLSYEDKSDFTDLIPTDECGGDDYYPSGSSIPKDELLAQFTACRVMPERLYVFSGASALGKSTFALSLASNPSEIYETDSNTSVSVEKLKVVKYIVLGNKFPSRNTETLEVLNNVTGRTIINVSFSLV